MRNVSGTHSKSIFVDERLLHLVVGDEGVVFEVMSETECFDVFLDAWRYLTVVPPEFGVPLYVGSDSGEKRPCLAQ